MAVPKDKPINSAMIKAAIARRHKEDMFFTEVKDGPTQIVRNHSKIDALGIKISWTNMTIVGYEVKVSRSDFLRDEKWPSYLPMCNQLYFAIAPGVCTPEEIPDVCGLVQLTPKGGLRTIKKAPWRAIETPVNMLLYLMFTYIGPYWRTDRDLPRPERMLQSERLEVYRQYLDGKSDLKSIGRQLSRKTSMKIEAVLRENHQLRLTHDESREAHKTLYAIARALEVSGQYDILNKCLNAIEALKLRKSITPAEAALFKQIHAATGKIIGEMGNNHEKAT